MAINFGGALYPWHSGQIISLFVVAGALFIVFALQQKFAILTKPSRRMFPLDFVLNKDAVLLFLLGCAANAGGYVPLYYIPLYFQFTRGNAALEAAVRLLPLVFLFSSTVIVNGALMSKYGVYQPWYTVGSVLLIAGGVLSCESRTPQSRATATLTELASTDNVQHLYCQYLWFRSPHGCRSRLPGANRICCTASTGGPFAGVGCSGIHDARYLQCLQET